MGIYDRDYYRREGPSIIDTFTLRGVTCKWLIIINVVVFVLQQLTAGQRFDLTSELWLDPQKVLDGQVWRLLTGAFLHGGIFHIVINMWMLWLFGPDVEEMYGRWEFLAFYLVAAVFASVAYIVHWMFTAFGQFSPALGASGATMAVVVLCACYFPRRRILLFFFIPMPIWGFAVFLVAQDFLGLLGNREGIGFAAHLGGAAFAFVYYRQHWQITRLFSGLRGFVKARNRPRLKLYSASEEERREPVSVSAPAKDPNVDEQLEAKIDAILEKVSRSGQNSLTDEEKELLMRASEIYKKKRN